MAFASPHVLLEMSDVPDCRCVAAWLFRAAQAQGFWQALGVGELADQLSPMKADGEPDFAAFALEILGQLEHRHHVVARSIFG